MEQTSDAHIAQALYEALDGRHAPAVAAFLDDASLLHVSGRSGLAGDYQGREAILGLLGRLRELTGGTLRYDSPSSAAEAGGTIVLLGRAAAVRRGKRLDTAVRISVAIRGRTLREIWIAHLDRSGFDDFWS